MGRKSNFKLKENDYKLLKKLVKKRNLPQNIANRYKILILSHEKKTYKEIEQKLDVFCNTINTWKQRYNESGIGGLNDLARPGRPKEVTAAVEAKVLKIIQQKLPPGKTHWSTSSISEKTGIPRRTVYDILLRNNLKPHLHKSFMVSNDPEFEKKASEIIGLYINPPKNAVVLCLDEKSAIQALNRLQPTLPMKPGKCERTSFEYKRNGTASLFAAFNTKTGKVHGACKKNHNRYDFIEFLDSLAKSYRKKEIHVILDNFRTHKTKEVKEWLKRHPNWKFHFTPTYSSWLNQIECWFSIISRQMIRRGVFTSVRDLISKIKTYIREYNKKSKPFIWTYSDVSKRITI